MLGAFLAAMLYDTLGPALLATLEPDEFQSTLQLSVNFLRPVRPGRLIGTGRVVHRDGDIALLEASLADDRGTPVATATATARVIPLDRAPCAPWTRRTAARGSGRAVAGRSRPLPGDVPVTCSRRGAARVDANAALTREALETGHPGLVPLTVGRR
jgi:acyl-CoA thioesterase superfamily protein